MPLIENSDYIPPLLFYNGHLQTVYPSLFRKINGLCYLRERIYTHDNDFIDLDWSKKSSDKVVIISHGLEGHSQRKYMMGMVQACNNNGWDAVAYNFRGCSGEPNSMVKSYHSGATDDLHDVVCHIFDKHKYKAAALIGFSLGGNLTLKYIGENKYNLSSLIKCAAAVSAPCDLKAGSIKLAEKSNTLYMKRFLRMFHVKIREKMEMMPGEIDDKGYESIKTFMEFDDRYTAPLNGFSSADEYYAKCSCKQYLPGIKIPALLLNAKNDPFLPGQCYPVTEAKKSSYLFLEMPDSGGHVGFIHFNNNSRYWHEHRVCSFINNYLN